MTNFKTTFSRETRRILTIKEEHEIALCSIRPNVVRLSVIMLKMVASAELLGRNWKCLKKVFFVAMEHFKRLIGSAIKKFKILPTFKLDYSTAKFAVSRCVLGRRKNCSSSQKGASLTRA
jgi:hypothetical protein